MTCADAITEGWEFCKDADPAVVKTYNTYYDCLCGDPNNPAITNACGSSTMKCTTKTDACTGDGSNLSADCASCITAAGMAGGMCNNEFVACAGS
jgi:hypothetical protein